MPSSLQHALVWCRMGCASARRNRLTAGLVAMFQVIILVSATAAVGHQLLQPGEWYRSAFLGLVALLIFLQAAWLIRQYLRAPGVCEFASQIERETTAFQSSLVTAVEIAHGKIPMPERSDWVLAGLAAQVEKGIVLVDGQDFVSANIRQRAIRVLLLSIAVLSLGVGLSPSIFKSGLRGLLVPSTPGLSGRVMPYEVSSVVQNLVVHVTPPAYTNKPPLLLADFSGEIQVLRGAEVSIAGAVAFSDAKRLWVLHKDAANGEEVREALELRDGTFELKKIVSLSGPFRFELEGAARVYRQKYPFTFEVKEDALPAVKILFPQQDQEVHLDDDVGLLFEAQDDFGVVAIRRVVRIAGAGLERMRPVGSPDNEKLYSGRDRIVFRELGGRPGDVLEISYEVEDNDSVTGPKTARSASRKFKIFSAEERHARLLERQDQLLDKMIIRLADRLEFQPVLGNLQEAQRDYEAYEAIGAEDAQFLREFEALLRDLAEDDLTQEVVKRTLQDMLETQRHLQERDAARLRSMSPQEVQNPNSFRKLYELNGMIVDRYESDVLTLDDLVIQQRQDLLANDADQLQRMEEDLRQILSSLRDGATDRDMQAAFNTLDRLEQQLERMRDDLAKMARTLPYENLNPEAMLRGSQSMGLSDVDEQLQKIRQLLREGKVEEALKLAESLEKEIQQLAEQMREGLMRPRTDANAEFAKKMSRASEDLSRLSREQEQLIKETQELEAFERKVVEERFRKDFDEELEDARREVADVRKRLSNIRARPLHKYDSESLKKSIAELDILDQRLRNRDVLRAGEEARESSRALKQLSLEMKLSSRRVRKASKSRKMKRAASVCENGGTTMEEVAERLESMVPDPKEILGKKGMRQSRDLERKQNALKQKLSEVGSELGEEGDGAQATQRMVRGMMEGAGAMMERASDRLGVGKPKHAQPHQEAALERMREAQRQIQKAMKPGGGGGTPLTGVDRSREPMEIPGEEAFQTPRVFRDLLMRTMKERTGQKFEGALEHYFKDLAR